MTSVFELLQPEFVNIVRQQLREDEGFRNNIFRDTVGKRTVGFGFNVDDPTVSKLLPPEVVMGGRPLNEKEAEGVLNKLIDRAAGDAKAFVGEDVFNKLDPVRQSVLVNMSFQLGSPRLRTFKKFRDALQKGDFERASFEIMNSKFARQVPNRASRNSKRIRKGS